MLRTVKEATGKGSGPQTIQTYVPVAVVRYISKWQEHYYENKEEVLQSLQQSKGVESF